MKRLPAFTLMEVLLSLLLLGLVGGMAAYIIQFLGRGGLEASARSIDQEERIALLTAWATDAAQAHALLAMGGSTMVFSMSEGVVTYHAGPTGVVRIRADGREDRFGLNIVGTEARTLSSELPLVLLWRLDVRGENDTTSVALRMEVTPENRYRYLLEHGDHRTDPD